MENMKHTIMLGTVNDVKEFVTAAGKVGFDIDAVTERHKIDAKSIMGVLSLDLSEPIEIVYNEKGERYSEADEKAFLAAIGKFIKE